MVLGGGASFALPGGNGRGKSFDRRKRAESHCLGRGKEKKTDALEGEGERIVLLRCLSGGDTTNILVVIAFKRKNVSD